MPISNKIMSIALFLLTGIPPVSRDSIIAKRDKGGTQRNTTWFAGDSENEYWESQKKYLVDPAQYYGSMPQDLEMAVYMMQHKKEFEQVGLYKSSNFIFYGPPGVGKTYVGSIFAQKIGAEFMYVQGSELQDCYVGGHRKPEELFARARRRRDATGKQIVMFIDEIDATVGSRDRWANGPNEQQMIAALLKEIGSEVNNGIIVVAATNKIENIDSALLRSGRMEYHIKFTLPTVQDREKFLQFIIKSCSNIFDSAIAWDLIARKLEGCNYADITKIINDLKQIFVVKKIETKNEKLCITQDDILQYLTRLKNNK